MMIVPRERVPASPLGDDNEDDGFANLSRDEIERLARERFQEQRVNLPSNMLSWELISS